MFVRSLLVACALIGSISCLDGNHSWGNDPEPVELIYFYDESQPVDSQSREAVRMAVESGFRIREIAANRFPNLAKRFQVRKFPSLFLFRRNRVEDRHEGRFAFSRIREMFAKSRENRLARRERIREFLVGNGKVERNDAPETVAPIAPRYIQTSTTNADAGRYAEKVIPKPLDRNGRFAVAHQASNAEINAFDATVRLRVVDPGGTSHGTGTIIHTSGQDALVLTCGHIFRESRGQGRIEADVSFSSQMKTVPGKLITFDSNAHDIALLTIRSPFPVKAVRIARNHFQGRLNQDVFTIGCDKGNTPTIRRSHFKRAARYDGTEKYDVFGRPIDGRSGGGLFNQQGELIGVCNAAAVHVDEGIYSGLKTIYRQLAISHLDHLFNETYWRPTPNQEADTRIARQFDNNNAVISQDGGVQFQSLPPNPALAFQSSNPKRASSRIESGSSRSASSDSWKSSVAAMDSANVQGQSGRQSPRIPSFQLSEKF